MLCAECKLAEADKKYELCAACYYKPEVHKKHRLLSQQPKVEEVATSHSEPMPSLRETNNEFDDACLWNAKATAEAATQARLADKHTGKPGDTITFCDLADKLPTSATGIRGEWRVYEDGADNGFFSRKMLADAQAMGDKLAEAGRKISEFTDKLLRDLGIPPELFNSAALCLPAGAADFRQFTRMKRIKTSVAAAPAQPVGESVERVIRQVMADRLKPAPEAMPQAHGGVGPALGNVAGLNRVEIKP